MLQKFIGAVVLVLVGSYALAETIQGAITAASDKEIAITPYEGKFPDLKKGEEKKLKVTAKTTYYKRLGFGPKAKTEEIEKDGNKALQEAVEKGGKGKFKGVFATVEEKDGTATKITFGAGKKGKPKPKDKDIE